MVDETTQEVMKRNFSVVDELDGMAFVLNQRPLLGRDLYFAYAEGAFFAEDPEAKKILSQLSFGPTEAFLPFLFYGVCDNYSQLVFAILDVILRLEKANPELVPPRRPPCCIYCLDREGDFGAEEHVVPEAFGLDELVLRDAVCKSCNNKLSTLDQFLAEFEPLALLRVFNVPLTKKGKFPRAETRDFVVEKVKPRVIRFKSKTGKSIFSEQPQPGGMVKLSTSITSRRPVDALTLGRSIFKIALGVVAADAGAEHASSDRFEAARRFIRGESGMPNHLLMRRTVDPVPSITTQWDPSSPTIVLIDIFGVRFAVNLEGALAVPPEVPEEMLVAFWLGEFTKNGVVEACRAGCSH